MLSIQDPDFECLAAIPNMEDYEEGEGSHEYFREADVKKEAALPTDIQSTPDNIAPFWDEGMLSESEKRLTSKTLPPPGFEFAVAMHPLNEWQYDHSSSGELENGINKISNIDNKEGASTQDASAFRSLIQALHSTYDTRDREAWPIIHPGAFHPFQVIPWEGGNWRSTTDNEGNTYSEWRTPKITKKQLSYANGNTYRRETDDKGSRIVYTWADGTTKVVSWQLKEQSASIEWQPKEQSASIEFAFTGGQSSTRSVRFLSSGTPISTCEIQQGSTKEFHRDKKARRVWWVQYGKD